MKPMRLPEWLALVLAMGCGNAQRTGPFPRGDIKAQTLLSEELQSRRADDAPQTKRRGSLLSANGVEFELAGRNWSRENDLGPEKSKRLLRAAQPVGSCISQKRATFQKAVRVATWMAEKGLDLIQKGDTPAYRKWFGAYRADYARIVQQNLANIRETLEKNPFDVTCGCPDQRVPIGTFVYVYAKKPYQIFICRAFWSLPLTGMFSQGSNLVHETSHYERVANTDDHDFGPEDCEYLARKNPKKAISNASNYQFFCAEEAENVSCSSSIQTTQSGWWVAFWSALPVATAARRRRRKEPEANAGSSPVHSLPAR